MSESQEKILIDIRDMKLRVVNGFHLSNAEARWLLAQIGHAVPMKTRCKECHGAGYFPVTDPEYEVVR